MMDGWIDESVLGFICFCVLTFGYVCQLVYVVFLLVEHGGLPNTRLDVATNKLVQLFSSA